jgi:glycosyltransferase involved in cell wall biosynthesis
VAPRPPLADPPAVAFAGRLTDVKGVDVLLRAMATIVGQVPSARLIVAGEGVERRRLERLADSLGLRASVSFLGHIPRPALDERLASAWVQAVPSSYPEPSANVVPEAMMRGTAVVASDVGGTPEMITEGTTGFLVPARDSERLAARLLDVLRDRALAERLGAAAREVALARLSTDAMVDKFEAIYASLVDVDCVPVAEREQSQYQ